MNKYELEKLFDKYFGKDAQRGKTVMAFDERNVKDFIFNTVIPEVLKSLMDIDIFGGQSIEGILEGYNNMTAFGYGQFWYMEKIKQRAKDLFQINL